MDKIIVNKHGLFALMVLVVYIMLYILGISSSVNILYDNIQFVSIIGLIMIIYVAISWSRANYRILSPYIIFIIALYLTLCGQSLPWAFGGIAGYRDLTVVKYNGLTFSTISICKALLFTYMCILTTHTCVLFSINPLTKKTFKSSQRIDENDNLNKEFYYSMVIFAGVLILVTALPYFSSAIDQYKIVSSLGYGAQYENVSYGVDSIMVKIGEFFPVGVLTLLFVWGKKNKYNECNFIYKGAFAYVLTGAYLLMELMLSQRTAILLFAIALIFIFFPKKKIKFRYIILGILSGIILMGAMRVVDLLRRDGVTISDVIDYVMGENNPVIDFLGDIGWNLMTTIEFQKLIPQVKEYGYGFSYLISTTSIIPNTNFWDIHPATEFGNISAWLQEYLGLTFGIGCTPVAEAYYNFGNLGFLCFIPWAFLIIVLNRKFEDKDSILCQYHVVLFMGVLLKSVVRSSMYAVFRPYIFYVIIPIFAIKLMNYLLSREK